MRDNSGNYYLGWERMLNNERMASAVSNVIAPDDQQTDKPARSEWRCKVGRRGWGTGAGLSS